MKENEGFVLFTERGGQNSLLVEIVRDGSQMHGYVHGPVKYMDDSVKESRYSNVEVDILLRGSLMWFVLHGQTFLGKDAK